MVYLERNKKRCKVIKMTKLKGFLVKPRGVNNVLICDKNIANNYAKKMVDKKFKKMYDKIYKFLISEDDSEDGVKACLGEIEKVKQSIFNTYKEHLKRKEYKEYLAKIVITEKEFRDKYMEREFCTNLIKNAIKFETEEEIRGKSR